MSVVRSSPLASGLGIGLALALILAAGAALRLAGLSRLDLVLDEREDLALLRQLGGSPNPFTASPASADQAWDQARLPFYLTGLAMVAAGDTDVMTARRVSVGCAVLAIAAMFLLGRELFGPAAGLLAAACQAFSIFDIGFSRLALTSSSSLFVACFLLSLWCVFRAAREDRVAWWWAGGIAAGVACAAKGFGVFAGLIAALWLRSRPSLPWGQAPTRGTRRLLRNTAIVLGIWLALISGQLGPRVGLAVYAATAVLSVLVHASMLRRAREPFSAEAPGGLLLGFIALMIVYALLASPAHLNAQRLALGTQWFTRWNNAPFVRTALWDYVPVLLVRLNFPFQLLWLAAAGFAWVHRREAPYRLVLLAFGVPFLLLSLLKWKANTYLLTVFPLCYLMIAALLQHLWQAWPAARRRLVLGLAACGLWYVQQLASLAPWYELDGYRLGPAWIGHGQAAFVTTERLGTVVRWLERAVPEGTEVAVDLINHPRYNGYAFSIAQWYARPGGVVLRQGRTLPAALASPVILLSLYTYTAANKAAVEAAGYRRVKTFWLQSLRYVTVYAKPDVAARMTRLDPDGRDPDAR